MTTVTPRQRRRQATAADIVEAAWELSRDGGLASLSMRDLADRVGMRAPSLYSYFESKDAIYDAMFRAGYRQILHHMAPYLDARPLTRDLVKESMRHWAEFCVADPVRYQLMFQRVVPGFEPTPESYAMAQELLDGAARMLGDAGVDDPAALDLWTALSTGLTDQQISNDPGGDRWIRLFDRAIDMFFDHVGALPLDAEASNR